MIIKVCIAAGVLVILATSLLWITQGAHRGWTQTKIPQVQTDPVTEIEFTVYEEGFKPGVDFLAIGLVSGIGAVALGVLLAKRPQK